jgi:hypothetical protein
MVDIDKNEPLHILLVEHSAERSELVKTSLDDAGVECRMHRVADLMEAIAYLREDMPYFNAPRPDFVVLGQSQEHICCCELLAEIGKNRRFAGVQTIGVRDSWWQRLPPGKAPMPFTCCELDRVKVARLGDTIKELEPGSLRSLLQSYA